MQVQAAIGLVQVDVRALAQLLPLPVHQGIFHLQGAVVAMAEPRGNAAGIDAKTQLRRQPVRPVDGPLHALIELLLVMAGEAGQFPQQSKRQPGLQVQPIKTGQAGFKAHGPQQRLHRTRPQGLQFSGGRGLQTGGHHGYGAEWGGHGRKPAVLTSSPAFAPEFPVRGPLRRPGGKPNPPWVP